MLVERLSSLIDEKIDDDQVAAIIDTGECLKVSARAGSGKTRLLVAKAVYLIHFYSVSPHSILLLSFNKKAAEELENRLKKVLSLDDFYTARTFHSLAYKIVQPSEEIVEDSREAEGDQKGKLIDDILRELWQPELRDKLYVYFRREYTDFTSKGMHLKGEDYFHFRRMLPQITLRGETVKSAGEKILADFFFEHAVMYRYEQAYRLPDGSIYRPDFSIWFRQDNRKFIWEHWAFDPEIPSPPSAQWDAVTKEKYRKEINWKQKFWNRSDKVTDFKLIETHAGMLVGGRQSFERRIAQKFEKHGIKISKLPQDELTKKIDHSMRSRLALLLKQFVNRALVTYETPLSVRNALNAYSPLDEKEGFFLELGYEVYLEYLIYLQNFRKTDFSIFFPDAFQILREAERLPKISFKGDTSIDLNNIRWVFVDEAQDLSKNYLTLLHEMQTHLPRLKFMFVGDDCQAINRFAGSDVELFNQIERFFPSVQNHQLTMNYRSAVNIVTNGNQLMKLGNSAKASKPAMEFEGQIERKNLEKIWLEMRTGDAQKDEREIDAKFFWGDTAEERRKMDPDDEKARLTKALFEIFKTKWSKNEIIAVLFRTNKYSGSDIQKFISKLRKCFRADGQNNNDIDNFFGGIEISTVHRVKGKQYDTVVIVKPHEGSFPLIHGDLMLMRFFGETPERALEDERRLFYVAITRAKNENIFLIEESRLKNSPFLDCLSVDSTNSVGDDSDEEVPF